MSAAHWADCMGVQAADDKSKTAGHPPMETIGGANQAFPSNTYTIEPGDHVCIDLATAFGECVPEKLFVNWCSGCSRTSIDTFLTAELLLDNTNLNGAAMNEQYHYVGEDPETCVAPEKFYVYNTNDAPQTVTVTPHS